MGKIVNLLIGGEKMENSINVRFGLIEMKLIYTNQLEIIFEETRKKIEKVFCEFREIYHPDYERDIPCAYNVNYNVDGVQINITDFLLLIGNFYFFRPNRPILSLGDFTVNIEERKKLEKKAIIEYENFLKAVPWVKLPERPKELAMWMGEK